MRVDTKKRPSDPVLRCRSYLELPDRRVILNPFQPRRVTSYGTIVFCATSKRWLVVRTRHSYALVTLLTGMFQKADVPVILSFLTADELQQVRKLVSGELAWAQVYEGYHIEESWERFQFNRTLIEKYLDHPGAVSCSTPWSFPKGRIDGRETPYACALREFQEETGLDPNVLGEPVSAEFISESYTSYDRVLYDTKCWVFCLPPDVPEPVIVPPDPDSSEIAERRWVTETEAEQLLSSSKFGMLVQAKQKLKIQGVV
jgi:8-oxo-dGTP pyrophosphatase MutT (NUDIX family)